jgi:outer membrane immunogenic protein
VPVRPLPPAYDWTGWYVGGNLGYSFGHADSNYTEPGFAGFLPTSFSGSEQLNGAIGGAQVGYNWQIWDRWIGGLETDIQFALEKGSRSFSNAYDANPDIENDIFAVDQTQAAKILWFGTVRARMGALVTPYLMAYATGGLAYGTIRGSGTVTDTGCGPPCSWSYRSSATNVGWTAGAGIEGAVPHTSSWTWKVEYLYIDLGSVSGKGFDTDFVSTYAWSAKVTDNIVRAGFNYKFDAW